MHGYGHVSNRCFAGIDLLLDQLHVRVSIFLPLKTFTGIIKMDTLKGVLCVAILIKNYL
jgi:hypothetical protein